ncbi:MAG: transketolase [Candidatus Nealsonbacteria bacterium]|nr:transketolase [Candidatus Nealsonbacteria bacterium]
MPTIKQLELMANKLRIHSLESTTEAGSGHATSSLSCAEIMSCLFFSVLGKNDEFVLSKGHAAPILWAALAEAGCFPREELKNLRKLGSFLEGHPTARIPWVRVATGSLGQGLSAGVGMALAKKLKKEKGKIFVLLGDGECAEGSVWEAANAAAYHCLDNILAIIDVNRLGQSGETMHGHNLEKYKKKFEAFGWQAVIAKGHSVKEILSAFRKADKTKKPFIIIAKTIKGKGVSFLENKEGWHGKALKKDELEKALQEIGKANITLPSKFECPKKLDYKFFDFKLNDYKLGEAVSTREAYGRALVNLGKANKDAVVIDGDVKNSTMTEYFFKEFPERSFQSFIAEQNMAGMAVGFSAMGLNPYVATFSAFLSRAHDFIRMANYSFANIKFAGSHSGISIGQDGPSQMGLEDIPIFLNIPGAIVLYPSDAVSAEYLLKETAKFKGISYLRTTREKTKVIYDNGEKFPVGSFKIWKNEKEDKALVIAAGVTLHEALKAQDILLKEKNISIRVIDLYSLAPLDSEALIKEAQACQNNVIVVEDHYCSALGFVVSAALGKIKNLCVKKMPESGKPEELMGKYGIDASAIIKAVSDTTRQ